MVAVLGELAQVLVALGVFLNAVVGLLGLLQSRRNGKGIQRVQAQTNGLAQKLVASAYAEGAAAGAAGQQPVRDEAAS